MDPAMENRQKMEELDGMKSGGQLQIQGMPKAPYLPGSGSYDELVDQNGEIRAAWRELWPILNQDDIYSFQKRQVLLEELIKDNGITYNLHHQNDATSRLWMMDLIPIVIAASEMRQLKSGLEQRHKLVNLILKDFYNDQELLKKRIFPPKLMMGSPSFLRACHKSVQVPNEFVHFYATDLARSPDGSWWVMSDRVDAASGLGYAMENRFISNRVYPNVFREAGIVPIKPFLETFRRSLAGLALSQMEDPLIVVLTPGPHNETFFEHSYLAKSMGFELVQGTDLTVRDQKLFLKTIEGLQQVNVVLRRLDSEWCDPLELRDDSLLGVPGLMQAIRSGNVALSNFPGCAVAESPAIMAFLPGICEYFLGESLKLPSIATWWCGQPKERDFVLDRLDKLIIKPAFGYSKEFHPIFCPKLSREELASLRNDIYNKPDFYCAQEPFNQSTTPVFDGLDLKSRPFLMRSFILSRNQDEFSMLPGGLGRIAADVPSYEYSMQMGGKSKDVWVISDSNQTFEDDTEMAPEPSIRRQVQTLSSHLADNLFWLGRNAERAEIITRTIIVVLKSILEEANKDDVRAASHLMQSLLAKKDTAESTIPQQHDAAGFYDTLGSFIHYQVSDKENRASLVSVISNLQRTKSIVKERISGNTNNILISIDSLKQEFENENVRSDFTRLYRKLVEFLEVLACFSGMIAENITRGPDWYFLNIGKRIERCLGLNEILTASLSRKHIFEPSLLRQLLDYADSAVTYRHRYLNALDTELVIDLVVKDPTNPRAMAFQTESLKDYLNKLPHSAEFKVPHELDDMAFSIHSSIRLLDLEKFLKVDKQGQRLELNKLSLDLSGWLYQFSNTLTKQYFTMT